MIENLPNWLNILFLIVTAFTLIIFYIANGKPKRLILILIGWTILHSLLSYNGFFLNTQTIPPRFTFVLLPPTILIIYGLNRKSRIWLYENKNLEVSTLLHTIRIFIEIILYYLFLNKMIPELMTFEGRNFDIFAGITAFIIGMLFILGKINDQILLFWNFIGLALILLILTNGILSSELPFQLFAFEQPNRAITYFPYALLPAVIVPIVIYSHISDILVLLHRRK
ncbi:MAG: hypothetical protein MK105_02050 [Crocinitomicaceae bacterium]|nr:hypothetical protein [Crocinitomicaceae bacterium]